MNTYTIYHWSDLEKNNPLFITNFLTIALYWVMEMEYTYSKQRNEFIIDMEAL